MSLFCRAASLNILVLTLSVPLGLIYVFGEIVPGYSSPMAFVSFLCGATLFGLVFSRKLDGLFFWLEQKGLSFRHAKVTVIASALLYIAPALDNHGFGRNVGIILILVSCCLIAYANLNNIFSREPKS